MLRNLQIRSKLVAILILPLLALVVLAANLTISRISASTSADRLAKITQFGASSLTDVADALQRERAVTNWYVAGGHRRNFGTMIADRVLVNEAAHALDSSVRQVDLGDYPPALRADLASAQGQLAQLLAPGGQRARLERPDATVTDVAGVYDPLIAKLIDAIAGIVASDTTSTPLTRNLSAFLSLARAKEASSRSQSLVLGALTNGSFGADGYHRFAALDGRQSAWVEQFQATATTAQRALFARTVAGRDIDRIAAIQRQLLTARGVPRGLTPQAWFFPTSARADLLHTVELGIKDDVLAAAASSRSSAGRQATLVTVAMALVLGLGVGLSLLLARSMAWPLVVLERTARAVADDQLPGVVERLQDAGEDVDLTAITQEAAAPVPIRSRDEIGRLAEAFNAVHQVAVRVAVEQAALRRSIGDMILNLARRSQSLIDRQLELMDELERDAEDDELEQMFKLDHLATRMRRNAENLIVLSGGADAARRLTQPVPLVDVVRAAMSEVEDYRRVELLPIDEISLTGHAVADVVHLLAELIENATSFSPPGTKVQIATQRAASGHVLEIEDRGLGMSDEELIDANHRLANPPAIDFALSRVLGLYVVGRLAQRHAIKVQLRHSWYGGVTALAMLPAGLMAGPGVPALPTGELPELVARDGPRLRAAEVRAAFQEAVRVEAGVDHLPIFEQARSDWFDTSTRESSTRESSTRESSTRESSTRESSTRDSSTHAADVPLRRQAPQQEPALAAPPPPPPAAPGRGNLPRRVPRATMAPGLDNQAAPLPHPTGGRPRRPDQVRAMLSSYSRGLERGRRMAGGTGSSRRNVSGSADGGNGPGPRRPTDHPDGTGELP
jgi:Nitrate and nitrite sensing/Histidine kinase-, DNA gyrase B-, and HSP90-like ATPase/HAMP domain